MKLMPTIYAVAKEDLANMKEAIAEFENVSIFEENKEEAKKEEAKKQPF
jgi:hypothetical protein